MSFNPMKEKGLPMDKHLRTWSEFDVKPYDTDTVPPYTRCRVILANGAEFASMWFLRNMSRRIADKATRQTLALTRRTEQQQQKIISLMVPSDESTLAHTIGYEQVAVDLTAWLAQHEPDPYVKAAFDFGLLEDFDHLYRFSNVLDLTQGANKPEDLVGKLTEITIGRPTIDEHRHPFDCLHEHIDSTKADFQTICNIMTLVGAEQQTMNFYMNVVNRPGTELLKKLYAEIGMIEEQHVSQYESLEDPNASWYKMLVCHEYTECYLYYSLMASEELEAFKRLWELHLAMEIEHLQQAVALQRKMENVDALEYLPTSMMEPMVFKSNIDYVRDVLATQARLTADGTQLVSMDQLSKDHRYFKWNNHQTAHGAPSSDVIRNHIDKQGEDYRFETAAHPVSAFRDRSFDHRLNTAAQASERKAG
jgi:hypothetical protein